MCFLEALPRLRRGFGEHLIVGDEGGRQFIAAQFLIRQLRGKRQRDTEALAMNMQLVTWRDARAANEAFVAGTGDALRTWRQP